MVRIKVWTIGIWLVLAGMVVLIGVTGCHWEASLGLGTVTASSTATVEEWAQTNVLKAIDDLIAKVPDPNKVASDPNKEDGDDEEEATEEPVDDAGGVDAVDGG